MTDATAVSVSTSQPFAGGVESGRRAHATTRAVRGAAVSGPPHRYTGADFPGCVPVLVSLGGRPPLPNCPAGWQRAAARLGSTPERAIWPRAQTAGTPTLARCLRPACDLTPAVSSAFGSLLASRPARRRIFGESRCYPAIFCMRHF